MHNVKEFAFYDMVPIYTVPLVKRPVLRSGISKYRVPFPTEGDRPLAGALPDRRATPSSLVRAPINGRFVNPDEVIPGERLALLHEIRPLVRACLGRTLGQHLASDSRFVA